LNDERIALVTQLKLLNELYDETKTEFDRQGFGSLKVTGYAADRNDEYQRDWHSGTGFTAAVKAFEKTQTTYSDRGLENTHIEFDLPLMGAGRAAVGVGRGITRGISQRAVRRLPAVLDKKVLRFLDDAARNGFKKAVTNQKWQSEAALNHFKEGLAEAAAVRTMQRAGYRFLPGKHGPNDGIDGVFVKYSPDGTVKDIIVNESKFRSKIPGYRSTHVLSNTKKSGQQLSERWFEETMKHLEDSSDPATRATYDLLMANRNKIRLKVNVLGPNGTNRWNRAKLPIWETKK
jgi:hypothetical protein